MSTPTPGAANQPATLGFVSNTHFSPHRSFYETPIDVLKALGWAGPSPNKQSARSSIRLVDDLVI